MTYWFRKGFFNSPFHNIKSAPQCCPWHSENNGPLLKSFKLSMEFYNIVVSSIVGLFLLCRPFKVSWLIAFIVIYAIYGMLWSGTMTYIGNDVREKFGIIITPLFIKNYPPPTVIFVGTGVFIITFINNAIIDSIKIGSNLSMFCVSHGFRSFLRYASKARLMCSETVSPVFSAKTENAFSCCSVI